MELIYRYPYNPDDKEWLKVTTKTHTEVIKAKKWPKHGEVIRDGSEGNGYHGRCGNCGYALVTDLGYTSWVDSPTCEVKREEIVTVTKTLTWRKSKEHATALDEEEATKHFNDLIHKQGWGKYNFQTEKIKL